MIQDLDRTLEQLLRDRVPLRTEAINFDIPNDTFRARLTTTGLTVNLYLYDLRENQELRSPNWSTERQTNGTLLKARPKTRLDLFYMVTTWSPATPQPDVLAEHALLSQILRTLLCYPTIPEAVLQGELIGQEPPLPTLVAQPDGMRNPSEFWSALRQSPRPGIHLVVTIAVEPVALLEPPRSLQPVVSRQIGIGQMGGRAYQIGLRSPLPQRYEANIPMQRMTIAPSPVAQLQQAIFASRQQMRVIQVRPLVSHEWVLIDDAANPEFTLLGEVPGIGEQEISVRLPLRFLHDPTTAPIPIRRVTAPEADVVVTSLEAEMSAGANSLVVARRETLAVNDVVLISDGDRSEVVQVTATGTGTGTIQVRPALRFAHTSNRNLFKRLLENAPTDPTTATRLAQPVAQSGSAIVLNQVIPAGTVLMIDTGTAVEFCQLTTAATAGNPVAITPPLRNTHPATTPVRLLNGGETIGHLQTPALAEHLLLEVVGEATAVEAAQRQGQPLLNAGDILQLLDSTQPLAVQVTTVTEQTSATQGAPEAFFAIGGWVTDNTSSRSPVVGARVSLRELQLQANTNTAGQFTFANLFPGAYILQVSALGYQNHEKAIQVPARSTDEYRITLSP